MATREVEPQEDLSRSEWNGLESTEHTDFNNTTSTADITTDSTITTSDSRIPALNPDPIADSDSETIISGAATTTAAIITNTSCTLTTTATASTTATTTTTSDLTNPTATTTMSPGSLTSSDPTITTTSTTTSDLPTDTTTTSDFTTSSTSTCTATISSSDLTTTTAATTSTTTTLMTADDDQTGTDEELSDELDIENATSSESENNAGSEDHVTSTPTALRPAPPSSLALSGSRPRKRKILVAPALSLSLEPSDSGLSEDFPPAFLSPSSDQKDEPSLDEEDTTLDIDLDAMETPSDSESLRFPSYDLDLEDEFRRLGVSSHQHRSGSSPRPPRRSRGFGSESASSLGCLDREDTVDSEGTRWRYFSTGEPPQEGKVNMSVVEPYLRVLSHGGYYGDGMNDIIVFSSCYLPENTLNNYHYVMDNLFRYVVGTLDLMVAENYVIVYLCAGAQKERLPGISWLRECYTTIDRRLRKNLKGLYVVHPTWFIKAMITIIKPFISSKFSRKLQFVDSLQQLSQLIPTEHVQIPDSVRQFDENLNR